MKRSKGTPAKSAPAKVKPPKAARGAIAEVLAPFGFPKPAGPGLCFDAEGDRQFGLGYPNVRFLSDEILPPAQIVKTVVAALDAIDPQLRITVPREVARAFLLGYRVGPLLFVDPKQRPENAGLREERLARIRSDRSVDLALLEETLEQPHAWGMGDTYSRWRWPKVLYLYEAFLGSEPVARAVVNYLLASTRDVKRWILPGKDPTGSAHHYIAAALPWLLLRVAPKVAEELRAELAKVAPSEEVPSFVALLHWLGSPPGTPAPRHGFETLDGQGLEQRLRVSRFEFMWDVGRVVWLLGSERLGGDVKVAGFDLPRMVDAIAPIRDPGVVRLMTLISAQRAGRKPASDWLQAHASYARPIVTALAKVEDAKQAAAAGGALELMGAASVDEAPLMSEEDCEQEVTRIFAVLASSLRATSDEARQIELIRKAYEAYTETRAASGDPTPEAYFTHGFAEHGIGEFAMLAVDSI